MYLGWIMAIVFGSLIAVGVIIIAITSLLINESKWFYVGLGAAIVGVLGTLFCDPIAISKTLEAKADYESHLETYEVLQDMANNGDTQSGFEYAITEFNDWVADKNGKISTYGIITEWCAFDLSVMDYITEIKVEVPSNKAIELAEIEVSAKEREYKVLYENGRMFGWTAVQERIGEYNRWVIEKQTEVKLLGAKSPYYYTNVMELNCIVGWGLTEEGVTT